MDNEHPVRRDSEVFDDLANGFAAPVHEGERLCKKDFSSFGNRETPRGAELTFHHHGRIERNQPVNDLEPHVVAGVLVLFSRIAKADDGKDLLFVAADITHRD